MRAWSAGGFTLVEVLVALFVLSVGIIGAAATQSKAHAAARQLALSAAAVQLASSLAERMRANPVAMAAPDGANPYLQLDYDSTAGAPPTPVSCYGDDCAPAALAAFDVYETSRLLHDGFPQGRLRVCRDAAPWDAAADRLSWDCAAGPGAPIVIKIGWRGAEGDGQASAFALTAGGSL
ncbi:type IV pilus modification protein PilV [Massilia solisilvae]|uniref:Type IV pilus modification protein PilV n=1 Tax=Massilia solisilvae TaxID=1811225 RepID=A0ABT2BJY6_9BURK|nr:type IV pilus modification protein PilV [Massilia solisilvae]